MEQDMIFMPLGGGQRVGASCYYLRICDSNLILDAGAGKEGGVLFEPSFHSLITSPFLQSMSQINQIYISHAHFDHVGCLLKLMMQTNHSTVYMTKITKVLSRMQLYDRPFLSGTERNEQERLAAETLFEKIVPVSYMQNMDFGKFRVSFLPAGHIPGAMMILFETAKRKILYTGDYSLESTLLTGGCQLPENCDIDTVIMCGLHAKHPDYSKKSDALTDCVRRAVETVESERKSVLCHVPQLSKGIEFLRALNEKNLSGIPVYLDETLMENVVKMERLSIPILNRYNKIMGQQIPGGPHIYVVSGYKKVQWTGYHIMKVDFSLHEDFEQMKKFIKNLNPRQAVLVHCEKEHRKGGKTIEQEIMADGSCRTQVVFAEENESYQL